MGGWSRDGKGFSKQVENEKCTLHRPKNVTLSQSLSFCVLICPSLYAPQIVSAPCSIALFPCPDLSLLLWSLGCECPGLGRLFPMS